MKTIITIDNDLIKNGNAFMFIKTNHERWVEEAKEVFASGYSKYGFTHNSYKMITTAKKEPMFWGLIDARMIFNLTYNGKILYITINKKRK